MPSKPFLTPYLLIAALLWPALGCASKERISPVFPSAEDLRVEAKPRLTPDVLGSEAALDAYEIEIDGWADRGWLAVARLCRWARANGMTGLDCPAHPPDS